jgi:hypothetical protein
LEKELFCLDDVLFKLLFGNNRVDAFDGGFDLRIFSHNLSHPSIFGDESSTFVNDDDGFD